MLGDIAVWIVVGGVALLVARRFYRLLAGGAGSCGCAGGPCEQVRSCNQSDGVTVECGNVQTDVSLDVVQGAHGEQSTKDREKGGHDESQTH